MFENLSKKLTDLGTDAASRAKNIGDRVSVTAKIEAAKRELTGVYAQLGQKLYQSEQDNVPAEYADLFEKIEAAEKKLETLQAQRQVLRQVRPCPDCGADVPNDAEFCAKCGCHIGAVSEDEPAEENF
ncbi:MAG: zinc ribbon domain-containing protein, partial [Eubacterium sp.]|nr:zinc ribbon domain-containing protein [Eubacterium sp.]